MPIPGFASELQHFFGPPGALDPDRSGETPEQRTCSSAVADFKKALADTGSSVTEQKVQGAAFETIRKSIEAHAGEGESAAPLILDFELLAALPPEFSH